MKQSHLIKRSSRRYTISERSIKMPVSSHTAKTRDEASKSKLQDVLENPSAHFGSPQEVAASEAFNDEQKAEILAKWEEDARRLALATEEGMGGGEPSRLTDVAAAQADLGIESDRSESPTKLG
jgi:hypothetical protein